MKVFDKKFGEVYDVEQLIESRNKLKEFDDYDYKTKLIGEYFGKRQRIIKLEEEFLEVIDAYLRKTDDDLVEELVDLKVVADSLINMLGQNKRAEKIYKNKVDRTIRRINEGILWKI